MIAERTSQALLRLLIQDNLAMKVRIEKEIDTYSKSLRDITNNDQYTSIDGWSSNRAQEVAKQTKVKQKHKFEVLTSKRQPARIDPANRPLTSNEQEVLARGLKFATVPSRIPYNAIIATTETTCKQLKNEEANYLRKEVSNALHTAKLPAQNVDKRLKRAILDLRKDESIAILPADKGIITVVMNKTDYRERMMKLLDDPAYKKLKRDPTTKVEKQISQAIKRVERKGGIPDQLKRKLIPQFSRPPQIYGLPKVHKDGTTLRPIVASVGSPTYKLAKELARVLSPLTGKTESFIKNSAEFANRIRKEPVTDGDMMVSFDVVSLFTRVPVDDALRPYQFSSPRTTPLHERTTINADDICSLTELCLRTTYFQFEDQFFEQIDGAAMGSPLSPIVANLYMETFEKTALTTALIGCTTPLDKICG